jgi:hypothetical protein
VGAAAGTAPGRGVAAGRESDWVWTESACSSEDSDPPPHATPIANNKARNTKNTLKFHLIGSPTCKRWTSARRMIRSVEE